MNQGHQSGHVGVDCLGSSENYLQEDYLPALQPVKAYQEGRYFSATQHQHPGPTPGFARPVTASSRIPWNQVHRNTTSSGIETARPSTAYVATQSQSRQGRHHPATSYAPPGMQRSGSGFVLDRRDVQGVVGMGSGRVGSSYDQRGY